MGNILKKHHKAFFAAQAKVHDTFRAAGATYRCLAQFHDQGDAMEIFSIFRGDRVGIVAVRYMMPRLAQDNASVFFYYDEALVGKLAGAKEFGTWDGSASLIKTLMPTEGE